MKKSAAKGGSQKADGRDRVVCENKKARFLYEVMETFDAGLVLRGTEVKVLRGGKMSLEEAYARVAGSEVWLVGSNVPEYSHGNLQNHEPKRKRKCLLHAREIRKLHEQSLVKGLTIVPLKVYFNEKGLAKVVLAVCKGRKVHDKREHLKQKDAKREIRDYR
jgi:SsrA-binding protein